MNRDYLDNGSWVKDGLLNSSGPTVFVCLGDWVVYYKLQTDKSDSNWPREQPCAVTFSMLQPFEPLVIAKQKE